MYRDPDDTARLVIGVIMVVCFCCFVGLLFFNQPPEENAGVVFQGVGTTASMTGLIVNYYFKRKRG